MTSGGGGGRARCSDGQDSLIARSSSLGIRHRGCGLHRCRGRGRRLWGIGVSRGLERAGLVRDMSGGSESRCGMRRTEYVRISFFVLIC